MAFVPGYENDVFVSYAHVDDRSFIPNTGGWVTTLVDTLKIMLGEQLGRAGIFTVWRDLSMTGNAPVTDALMGALGSSATLLMILSEGYLASEWCQREQTSFLAQVGTGSRRVFVVERVPIDRARKPGELQDLIGYPFWTRERDEVPPATLGVPTVRADDVEYFTRLTRLATELAGELKRLRGRA